MIDNGGEESTFVEDGGANDGYLASFLVREVRQIGDGGRNAILWATRAIRFSEQSLPARSSFCFQGKKEDQNSINGKRVEAALINRLEFARFQVSWASKRELYISDPKDKKRVAHDV